ncbi:MAG: GIY-YIG nuclease family protein [Methylocystaceae bacterium]
MTLDRRKELKLQYKQNPPPMGVYQIRNNINGKIWVASSMNLHGSSNSYHYKLATTGAHRVKELRDDWERYGPDAFVFEVLETVNPDEFPQADWRAALALLEEIWLEKLQPYGDKGYNRPK